MPIDEARLREIEERERAATEGPWSAKTAPHPDERISKAEFMASLLRPDWNQTSLMVVTADSDDEGYAYLVPAVTGDGPRSCANAEFIAASRQDIPDLVRDLREARELLREARELLGCETSCGVPCPVDGCDDGCANHLFLAKTASREEGDGGQKGEGER